MDGFFLISVGDVWHGVIAQASPPDLQSLVQQVDALQTQLDTFQNTNQLLSDSLTQQIEFLRQENQDLTNSFTKYVDAMKWNLTVLAGLAAILTAVGGWIFKSNLDDAKQVAQEMINRRVEAQISTLVNNRVEEVSRTIRREQVVGETYVDYCLPGSDRKPPEFSLLNARQFKDLRFINALDDIQNEPGNVVVLDLVNYTTPSGQLFSSFTGDDREAVAQPLIGRLLQLLPSSTVVVVYVNFPPLKAVNQAPRNRYVIAANNPITLVGNTADGAYVALGDRAASR